MESSISSSAIVLPPYETLTFDVSFQAVEGFGLNGLDRQVLLAVQRWSIAHKDSPIVRFLSGLSYLLHLDGRNTSVRPRSWYYPGYSFKVFRQGVDDLMKGDFATGYRVALRSWIMGLFGLICPGYPPLFPLPLLSLPSRLSSYGAAHN